MNLLRYLKSRLRTLAGIFILVTLGVFILMISEEEISLIQKFSISSVFGFISLLVTAFNMSLFYMLIPGWSQKYHRVFSLQGSLFLVITIISISLANYGYVLYLSGDDFDAAGYMGILLITFLIGLIPIIVIRQMEANRILKEKVELNKPIEKHIGLEKKSTLSLKVEDLRFGHINLEQLLYAEANRNYVRLRGQDGEEKEIRITLKELEDKLSDYPFIIRCHRSFLVNMDKVNSAEGNAKGYLLHFDTKSETPPVQVSRSYVKAVRNWLTEFRNIS
jgi:hypothetical protein